MDIVSGIIGFVLGAIMGALAMFFALKDGYQELGGK